MLAYIKGDILQKNEDSVLVLTKSGVGYQVFCASTTLTRYSQGDAAEFYIYQYLKEDKNDLYGFELIDEKNFFEMLLSVSGLGPKSALQMFNLDNMNTLKSAISTANLDYLTQIPGIGQKTAKKILLELQDKLDDAVIENQDGTQNNDLRDALLSLGYKTRDIHKAIAKIDKNADLQTQIKQALAELSGK